MTEKKLYTIGYEGADLADFLAALTACGVALVIDIRDVPISRKRGFSKRKLADVLATRGINYIHLKDLGDPKPGRAAAKRGEFAVFREIFDRHLQTIAAQEALNIASHLAEEKPSCLLCFERIHENCHRTLVANALSEKEGFAIQHLGVRKSVAQRQKHDHDCTKSRELTLW